MAPVNPPSDMSSIIEDYIKNNKVFIFSKSTCPYCNKVKKLFDSLKVNYHTVELNQIENGSAMQLAMASKVGKSSVPQVFINGHHVGGCDDTIAAHRSGELNKLLSEQDLTSVVDNYIANNKILIFSKSTCPYCQKVKELFSSLNVEYLALELDEVDNGHSLHKALTAKTGRSSVPQVFVNGQHLGGCDDTMAAHSSGNLQQMLSVPEQKFDYDLVVIGGGSGGLASSKEAARLGKKVAVFDFVTATPIGTTWGLGGTCVNVGCIPKKLMHHAALLGQAIKDARSFGWQIPDNIQHNWDTMKDNVQTYIHSLNWGYKVALKSNEVKYFNSYASFVSAHEIVAVDKKKKEKRVTAKNFIIATGERPRYPTDCEGAVEFGVTSDDIFSLEKCPGKTLVIGASYVALECAGFMHGIGLDVTVMVRSILLRGFDQQMAEMIGEYMQHEGLKFIRPCVPHKIEKISDGFLRVTARMSSGEEVVGEYNTVLFAIGRDPCTDKIGLDEAGVIKNPKNGKIPTIHEQTNVSNIYAIGDILLGRPELTPVAIEAGVLLAQRLFNHSHVQCDYLSIPTTVFTPLEYGCIGYSEEAAIEKYGDDIEVYHSNLKPLEWSVPGRPENSCYIKLICLIPQHLKIIGFHYLGPNAGEVTQGFALGIKKGATKADMDAMIGIHPTCAELFTTLTITKRSGMSIRQAGC